MFAGRRLASLATILTLLTTKAETQTTCGGELTQQSGTITSPNFPNSYTNNTQCQWTITAAKNQVIDLRFIQLDLERYSDNGCLDYLMIYDGATTSSPIVTDGPSVQEPVWWRQYCGYRDENKILNIHIRSSSNQLHLYFYSDQSGTRSGFSVAYKAHECPSFTFGEDACTTPCTCDKSRTSYCVSKNGTCVCNRGWTSADCSKDINECDDPNRCPDLFSDCKNLPGSFQCDCKPGLTQNSNGTCEDSKQCTQKKCSHACIVTSSNPRQEQCICPKGTKLDPSDNASCVACDEWKYGENCAYTCGCKKENTAFCDKRNGLCSCYLNWTNTNCTDDVNECGLEKRPCDTTTTSCYNFQGSFECRCLRGYEKLNNMTSCAACGRTLTQKSGSINSSYTYASYGQRLDAEECNWTITAKETEVVSFRFQTFSFSQGPTYDSGSVAFYDGRNSSAKLIQKFYCGSYNSPPNGIIRSSGNEMYVLRNGSAWSYLMTFAGYYWTHECPEFMYDDNCTTPCTCVRKNTEYCNSTTGQCVCKPGWKSSDCSQDVDECYDNPLSCPDYSVCRNFNGSFDCTCKVGLVMNSDGKCVVNSQGGSGGGGGCIQRSCSHVCVQVIQNGQSTPTELCYCPIGMELDGNQCVDCKNTTYGPDCYRPCECIPGHTERCDPRTGNCTCFPGWTGKFCADDVDECKLNTAKCKPFSNCTNTLGSYTCNCSKIDGYEESANGFCSPINCSQTFTNASGIIKSPNYPSYYFNNANCSFFITVAQGNIISLRLSTFYINYYDSKCSADYLAVYDGSSRDARLIGSYCYSGMPEVVRSRWNNMLIVFVSDWRYNYGYFNGSYTSHPCGEFTYGDTVCDKNCSCVRENTDFCNNVNGQCVCKPGWAGRNCSEDVNECLSVKVCPENSDCVNSDGSYRCSCHRGYAFNVATGLCDVDSDCVVKKCSHTCYVVRPGVEQCVCPEGLVLDQVKNLSCVVPMYPYGDSAQDSFLTARQSSSKNIQIVVSSPIYFGSGVPFGSTKQTAAFVWSNGLVTFGGRTVVIAGEPSLIFSFDNKIDCIAPFWADIKPNAGQVSYHLYERCGAAEFSETGYDWPSNKTAEVFQRAENDVVKFHGLSGFTAVTVLVVTWENVKPYAVPNQSNEENTFQMIYVSGWEKTTVLGQEILSDEKAAYTIFIYKKMNWAYVPGRHVNVGMTGSSVKQLKDTDTALVSMLDQVPGNVGFTGVLSYEAGRVSGPQQLCDKYVCNHVNLLSDPVYQSELRGLYQCPCTLERLGMQWQLYEKRGAKNDIYCYVISALAKRRLLWNNRRNNLCCYQWNKPDNNNWQDWLRTWREATYIPASSESGHVLINDPFAIGYFNNYEATENVQAHRWCCGDSNNAKYCDRFYQIFPDMGCSNFVLFVPASALGDPHITTIDGLKYTMNGWGEFEMMRVSSAEFTLQARTGRVENANGSLTNATVFTAFAAKESNYSRFQVELSSSNTTMVITANGKDLTNDFYANADFSYSDDTISVKRENDINMTTAIFAVPCGVAIKVNVGIKCLEIEFEVDKSLQNKTLGLMGNFDGNVSNDFMLPNRTVLPANMSERDIYIRLAKNWLVTAENSAFTYSQGKTTADYQHLDFMPTFRDEADPAKVAEAENFCGNENNGCIFDYLVTNNANFAQHTRDAQDKQETFSRNLENNPPTIMVKNGTLNSNNRLVVENGKRVSFKVIAVDEDNDTVTFELVGNVTSVSIDQTGNVTYLPDVTKPVTIRVRAIDSKGGYSPTLTIPIMACSGCSGHGQCDTDHTQPEEYESGRFQICVCNCDPAYTGDNCENELDGCAGSPCSRGQNCTDLTPAEQGNSSIGYKCGPCPTGFQDINGKCGDIDECVNSNGSVCDQVCINTEGSFICSCKNGFRRDIVDKTCTDINECEEKTSKCVQECRNTNGNYTCACREGYTLNSDGVSCTINSNNSALCQKCQQVCSVSGGQATCSCNLGYEVDPSNVTQCRDINECTGAKKPCSQLCINTEGNFQCKCYTGYRLDADETSCQACEKPFYGINCGSICQCNNRGTCDPVRGCVCDSQWTGANCEVDFDECTRPSVCGTGLVCKNKPGSFDCVCPDGYQLENGKCQDINECTVPFMNITCDKNFEDCVNNVGSYSCECKQGYSRNNQSICEDVDECQKKIDKCEQICVNVPGQYNCKCNAGYEPGEDRFSCRKVSNNNPCGSLNCSYGCHVDSSNMTVCFCPRGLQINGLGKCVDINECSSNTLNLCEYKPGCNNTEGGFICNCQDGYKLDNDGRSCIACSGGTWGKNCSNSCACGTGADHCNSSTGCVCKSGFTGNQCNLDIDECQGGLAKCSSKENCVNLPGTYLCDCLSGYERISASCEDIDECENTTTNNCSQVCNNTVGGFTCSCYPGYIYDNTTNSCSDINECQTGTSQCENTCINTEGSYRCSCGHGQQIQSDGLKCGATVPCRNKQNCSYLCASINGTDTCVCPKGKTLSSADGKTCIDCDPWKFGRNCSQSCQCNTTTSSSCNKTDGTCACISGWTGSNCSQDVNECAASTPACSAHSTCINKAGTFSCNCQTGYIMNPTSKTCQDVNECSNQGTSPCDQICTNTDGSYQCSCGEGYITNRNNSAKCIETVTYSVTLTFSIDVSEVDLANKNSESYKNLKKEVEDQIFIRLFRRLATLISVIVINLRQGSLIADYNVTTEKPSGTDPFTLALLKSNNEGNYSFSNKTASVTTANVNGRDCRLQNEDAVCRPEDNDSKDVNECSNQGTSPCDQICTNTDGSYQCSCGEGYITNRNNSAKCIETVTYSVTLTFSIDVSEVDLANKNSESYKNLKKEVEDQIFIRLFRRLATLISVIVINLRQGSLIADYNVTTEKPSGTDPFTLALLKSNNEGNYSFSNKTASVTTANVNGRDCRLQNEDAVCRPEDNDSKDVNECSNQGTSPCDQICTNTDGSYQCSCGEGYITNRNNSAKCIETVTYSVTLTFSIDVSEVDLANKNSESYKNLKKEVEDQIFIRLFRRLATLISVIVINLRQGSLIADYNVTTEKPNGTDPFTLALLKSNNEGNYSFSNKTASVTTVNVNGRDCRLQNEDAVCRPEDNTSDDNKDLALGLGLGIPLFIILCAVVGGLTYCWARKQSKITSESNSNGNTSRKRTQKEDADSGETSRVDNPYYHFESKYQKADRLSSQWQKAPAMALAGNGDDISKQPAMSKSGYEFPSYGGSSRGHKF